MPTRRSFLLDGAAILAASFAARRASAAFGIEGELGHPVPPPPSLEFRTLSFEHSPLNGGPSTAIAAVPRDLAPGEQLPLVVLLPGGHSNWQPHDAGCWCWWCEYNLGDCDTALRRGALTSADFQDLARPEELESFNRNLASAPYRGVVIVTPWCLTRDSYLEPNGPMNSEWLRVLVDRCRAELPVIPTVAATGLGGMSSGGLWAIYCGSHLPDVFGFVNALQPYTRYLLTVLERAVLSRKGPQRLRIVGAFSDRIHEPTMELVNLLRQDGIDLDYYEYLGMHDGRFVAGPGGIDTLFTFDRVLRGMGPDGLRPLPMQDGLAQELWFAADRARVLPAAAPIAPPSHANVAGTMGWASLAVGGAVLGVAAARKIGGREGK